MRIFLALLIAGGLSMSALGAKDKKAMPDEQFKKMDANNDSKVNKEEYVGKRKGDKATKAEELFKKLDKNSDGSLELEEFKAGGKKAK
jgi:Ca2+-binding EF-hand superfamily protein